MSVVGSRRAVVGVVAVAAVLLAGCTSVVDGKGAPALGQSGTVRSRDFPSGSPVPSATASATTESTTAPAGELITYAEGHLRARFPSRPTERRDSGTVDGLTFVTHTAAAPAPVTLAAAEDINQPLPESAYQATLRATIGGFAATSGLTLKSQTATTFEGHVARTGALTSPTGTPYTLLALVYTSARLYLLFTESGRTFTAFASSFAALP
jgi:hypothetical protein